MTEALLAAGADPNAPVLSHGETPLMMAARTHPAGGKSIPSRAATVVEVLRILAVAAVPAA